MAKQPSINSRRQTAAEICANFDLARAAKKLLRDGIPLKELSPSAWKQEAPRGDYIHGACSFRARNHLVEMSLYAARIGRQTHASGQGRCRCRLSDG